MSLCIDAVAERDPGQTAQPGWEETYLALVPSAFSQEGEGNHPPHAHGATGPGAAQKPSKGQVGEMRGLRRAPCGSLALLHRRRLPSDRQRHRQTEEVCKKAPSTGWGRVGRTGKGQRAGWRRRSARGALLPASSPRGRQPAPLRPSCFGAGGPWGCAGPEASPKPCVGPGSAG